MYVHGWIDPSQIGGFDIGGVSVVAWGHNLPISGQAVPTDSFSVIPDTLHAGLAANSAHIYASCGSVTSDGCLEVDGGLVTVAPMPAPPFSF